MIIELLIGSIKGKKKSALALEIFVSNHQNKCLDEFCICRDSSLLRNIDLNKENALEKSKTVLAKKDLILNLISKCIQDKMAKLNHQNNNNLKLIYASYLLWRGKNHYQINQITSLIIKSESSYLESYHALIIRYNMKMTIKQKKRKIDDELFIIKVIEYYELLNTFKSLIFLFLKTYQEFLKIISNSVIDLNDVLNKGKILIKQKAQLLNTIHSLQKIYHTTTEFYILISLYSQLGFIDQITSILEENKHNLKISKKLGLKDNTYPLTTNICAVISKYTLDKNAPITKATPNFYKIFGYDPLNFDKLTISQLMPKAIGQYHNEYIKAFSFKPNGFINHTIINNVPAINSQGLIFTAKIKVRFDFFNDEAYLTGLFERCDLDKDIILLDELNRILNFSHGLTKIFLNSNALLQLPIGLFIPRYLLALLPNNENRTQLCNIYQSKGLFDIITDFTSNIKDELESTYLIIPNNLNQLLKLKSMINKINHESSYDILIIAKSLYIDQEEEEGKAYTIYKAHFKFEEYKYNDKRICMKSISLAYIKIVNDNNVMLLIREYIQNLLELSSIVSSKSILCSDVNLCKKLFQNSTHSEDLSNEINLPDIFVPSYRVSPNPIKTLSFFKIINLDEQNNLTKNIRKSTIIKITQLEQNINSNNMNNNKDSSSILITSPQNHNHNHNHKQPSLPNICTNKSMKKSISDGLGNSIKSFKIKYKEKNDFEQQNLTSKNHLQKQQYHQIQQLLIHQNNNNENNTDKNNNQIISTKSKNKPIQEKQISIDNRSNGSSLSSNTSSRAFKELLNRKISIRQLDWLHYFGIFILITMIIIISFLTLLLETNINKYNLYVNCSDFPNIMLSSIGIYGQYLVQYELIENEKLNSTSLNLALLGSILPQIYDLYKDNFDNAVFKQHIFENSYNLRYNDYEMELIFHDYDNNDAEIVTKTPYYHAISYMMDILYYTSQFNSAINQANSTINQAISIINQANNSMNEQESYLYFIFRNFPKYFKTLIQNTWDIGDEAYGSNAKIDIESFALKMLICCVISTFTFIFLIYPIYYSIETKQKQGISLIATISITEIMKIHNVIEHFLDCSTKQIKKKLQNQSNLKNRIIMKNTKSVRQSQFKRFNSILFISILLIFYGIWSAFFIVQTTTVTKQNVNFKQYYYEYDFIADFSAALNSEFFITWLTIYINDHKVNQNYYFTNYNLPKIAFENNLINFVSFWTNVDEYISNNTQITDSYLNTHLYLKEHDLCFYIDSYIKNEEDLKNCQSALNSAMKNGILKTILMLSESLVDELRIPIENNLKENKSIIEGISSSNLKGVSDIQPYIIYFFQQYVYDLKLNLYTVLGNNLQSLGVFLGLGIFMFLGSFTIFWMPFVNYLRQELYYVKRIYCCLPALTIMQNPYVKKWLNNNSLHV